MGHPETLKKLLTTLKLEELNALCSYEKITHSVSRSDQVASDFVELAPEIFHHIR